VRGGTNVGSTDVLLPAAAACSFKEVKGATWWDLTCIMGCGSMVSY